MILRKLEPRDAEPMLAWMHDPDTVGLLNTDFGSKTLADCETFITSSRDESVNLHRAIANREGHYLGTVSLKGIDRERKTAEFAITVGPEGRGTGAAAFAMAEMLQTAFEKLGLETVYWYVNRENRRAIRFYEKQGFQPLTARPAEAPEADEDPRMVWFLCKAGQKPVFSDHEIKAEKFRP